MVWRSFSIIFLLLGFIVMPAWPYSQNWSWFAPAFCWFLGAITFLASVFARRGSELWRKRGQG